MTRIQVLFRGLLALGLSLCLVPTTALADAGLVVKPSAYDVKTTGDRLVSVLEKKGLTVFTRIDHAAGADSVGQSLLPMEIILFGNPKLGTPLMKCASTAGIDLPQKALIWQDDAGKTSLAYNDPAYLKQRHGIEGCDEVLKKVSGALGKLTDAAVSK